MPYRLFISALLISLSTGLQAQPQSARLDMTQARFKHLGEAEGMPENSARALLQDHLGFLWIGTQNGLVRYDGVEMKVYQNQPDDPHSLQGRVIYALEEDRNGDLWIGSRTGLEHFERATGRFTLYQPEAADARDNEVHFIYEDRAGDLWVISVERFEDMSLLDRFNPRTKTWTSFRHDPADPQSLVHNKIGRVLENPLNSLGNGMWYFSFYEDRSGNIWVGTQEARLESALHRLNRETDSFTRFEHDPTDPWSLSLGYVGVPYEDQVGQLWIPIWGGGLDLMDRATGTFMHMRHDPENPQSLISDEVLSVYQDKDKMLWISTTSGLSRMNPETPPRFTHYRHNPDDLTTPSSNILMPLHESADGDLWFASDTDGIDYYDRALDRFVRLQYNPDDPGSLVHGFSIESFLVDRAGTVWVGTWLAGLNKLDRTARFRHYARNPADENSLADNGVRALYKAPSEPGVLWIGTESGLSRLDRNESPGRFTHYRHNPKDPHSITPGAVEAIYEDQAGRLWVGSYGASGSGLNLVDRRRGTMTRFLRDPANPNSLSGANVISITGTRDGALWIGMRGQGLNRFNPETGMFTLYGLADTTYAEDLFQTLDNLSTDHQAAALLRVGVSQDLSQRFTVAKDTHLVVIAMGVWSQTERFDYGWIEDEAGTIVWQPEAERSRYDGGDSFKQVQVEVIQLSAGTYQLRYRSDEADAYGSWTIGSPPRHPEYWGIQVLQVTDAEADAVAELAARRVSNGLSALTTPSLMEDRNGYLWVGLGPGDARVIERFDPKTETFEHFKMPGPSNILALHEDRAGYIWVGSLTGGLYRIDPSGEFVNHYTADDGLPSNAIPGILEDDAGNLWLGTSNGLVRFDPETEQFKSYGLDHGLQGTNFSRFPARSSSGEMFFGGPGGFNAFFPQQIIDDPYIPPVVLTRFQLFNEDVPIGPDAPLKADISVLDELDLAYNENDITLYFAALDFNRSDKNTFAYQLEPYDADWVDAGTLRQARYTNLSPGSYTFRVKAANADGVWNETGRTLAITIHPPWWRTTWAYLIYGLLFGLGIWVIDRSQRRRLIRRERERAHEALEAAHTELQQAHTHLKTTQAQLVQQEKMASLGELTAGIAHEIKNPLNFVNNFAELMGELVGELEEELDSNDSDSGAENPHQLSEILADLKSNAEQIAKHGRRADGIVSAMMQHASGGTGKREPTDVNALLEEYVNLAYHGKRAQKEGFNCEIKRDYDHTVGKVVMIPQDIGRVFLNLLSNAFDAVAEQAQPTVRVQTQTLDDAITIRVTDNGPGIHENLHEKIFMPFFTTKPTGSGTGLGLSMSYDIITQGHGGTLEVESTEGEGATFIIELPT